MSDNEERLESVGDMFIWCRNPLSSSDSSCMTVAVKVHADGYLAEFVMVSQEVDCVPWRGVAEAQTVGYHLSNGWIVVE